MVILHNFFLSIWFITKFSDESNIYLFAIGSNWINLLHLIFFKFYFRVKKITIIANAYIQRALNSESATIKIQLYTHNNKRHCNCWAHTTLILIISTWHFYSQIKLNIHKRKSERAEKWSSFEQGLFWGGAVFLCPKYFWNFTKVFQFKLKFTSYKWCNFSLIWTKCSSR